MKYLENAIKIAVLRFISLLLSPPKLLNKNIDLNSLKRILVIRQHDQLGDLLLITPGLRALRKSFPDSFISIVVREYTLPVILGNPNVDKIIVFRESFMRWNISYAIKFYKDIRQKYDCAIILNTVSRSTSSDLIALLSKSKIIIAPKNSELVKGRKEIIYNLLAYRSEKQIHQIERNLETIKSIRVKPNGKEYDLILNKAEREEGNKIFKEINKKNKKKVIGVHFGTLDISRRLPLNVLSEALNYFIKQNKYLIVLIVSKNEIELCDEFESLLIKKVKVAPLMPLRIFTAFLKNLDLFLCNDTGTLHIASSQRVPTVSFHAKNDPKEWKPPHPRHIGVRAKDHLITSITSEHVIKSIEKAIKSNH